MLIVIPVSVSDQDLIPSFLASIKRCGNIKNHDVVVLTTPSAAIEAGQLAGEMANYASSSRVVKMDIDPLHGWPFAPNMHFCDAVHWVAKNKIQTHWYWMELDCTVLKPGWADELDREYRESRKMFMGAVVPTIKIRNPNTPQAEPFQQGSHMVGTGIYPPIMPEWCLGWKSSKMRPNGPYDIQDEDTPFDVTMGYETAKSLHDTKLIQHQFRTVNYRRDGDYIVGEDQQKLLGVSFTGRVSEDAVVHHGCKDGSLSNLLNFTKKVEPDTGDEVTEIIPPNKKPGRKPQVRPPEDIEEPGL
jgi:hypothetical protein